MKPVQTAETTENFAPPPGVTDGSIGDLPCAIIDEGRGRTIYSVWELSDEERKAIANGWNVRLGVAWIGAMPPVSLGVTHLAREEAAQPVAV
jgi:hypothetical protein